MSITLLRNFGLFALIAVLLSSALVGRHNHLENQALTNKIVEQYIPSIIAIKDGRALVLDAHHQLELYLLRKQADIDESNGAILQIKTELGRWLENSDQPPRSVLLLIQKVIDIENLLIAYLDEESLDTSSDTIFEVTDRLSASLREADRLADELETLANEDTPWPAWLLDSSKRLPLQIDQLEQSITHYTNHSPDNEQAIFARIDAATQAFDYAAQQAADLNMSQDLTNSTALVAAYRTGLAEFIDERRADPLSDTMQGLQTNLFFTWDRLLTKLNLLAEQGDRQLAALHRQSRQLSASAQLISSMLVALSIVLTSLIFILITALIRRRLSLLIRAHQCFAAGDTEHLLTIPSKDEFGRLSESFNQMATQITRNTAALAEAVERADAASQSKSMFLANISHEMRTPMHAIITSSDLASRYANDAKLQRYMLRIKESARRLTNMLNDLLDLSKLEAHQMLLQFEVTSLAGLIQHCVDELRPLIVDKSIQLTMHCESRLAAEIDPLRMSQVVSNLLSNAIKFSPREGRIAMSIASCPSSGQDSPAMWKLEVSDQGHGIPESELDSIFDKFVQSSASVKHGGGTGLGLAICDEIVELHQGRIWAESPARDSLAAEVNDPSNPGATFHVLLPIRQETQESASLPANNAAAL